MNELEVRHRLTAILAADAAAYSRVMAEDDRIALSALDAARAVFRTHIQAQGGRIIDTAGDSVLAPSKPRLARSALQLPFSGNSQSLHTANATRHGFPFALACT